MKKLTPLERAFSAQIEMQKPALASADPDLRALRLNAMQKFAESGLPSRQDEAWRWTDLTALNITGEPVAPSSPIDVSLQTIPFAALDAYRMVFVNGLFQACLSDLDNLPDGVNAGSLSAALQSNPALAQALEVGENAPFLSLNTALLNDGAWVQIAEDVQMDKPLHLIFYTNATAQVRNLLQIGAGASLTLLESHYGPAGLEYFVNQASNLVLQEGAHLSHIRDQDDSLGASHFQYLSAKLNARASYDAFTLTRGAALSRNEAHLQISGRDAHCRLNGAYILNGKQIADTTAVVDHQAPNCQSSQLFRGVLNDQSRGIFQGLIRVRKTAQRTDAQQQIKALLLSPGATQNSKPELEILADDVKCAHGATIGQIDEAALFYLRSRGIALPQARAMLIGAFVEDALTQIQDDTIQRILQTIVTDWLAQQMVAANV